MTYDIFFIHLFQIQLFEPSSQRYDIFKNLSSAFEEVVVNEFYDKLGRYIPVTAKVNVHLLFAPPTTTCYECGSPLTAHNKPIEVRYYGLQGFQRRLKISTRCTERSCRINYHIAMHGNKQNQFVLYPVRSDVIEVTDGVIIDRQLFEMYCNSQ